MEYIGNKDLLKESKKDYTIIRQPSKDRRRYDSNKSKAIM